MTNNLLSISNLSVYEKNSNFQILTDINLNIQKGEIVSIIGRSGSGKTIMGLSIMRLLDQADFETSSDTKIQFDGKNIIELNEDKLCAIRGNEVSIIMQNPGSSFNAMKKVFKQIMEPLFIHKKITSYSEGRKIVLEILEEVGLGDLINVIESKYPHQLSGGQLQRCMIAMAIINKPKLIIADEPTKGLDAYDSNVVLDILYKYSKNMGVSVILITHDMLCVQRISTRVYAIDSGEIIYDGSTEMLFCNNRNERINDKIYFLILENQIKNKVYNQLKSHEKILEIKNLSYKYEKKSLYGKKIKQISALRDINLTVSSGENLGIIGQSGSGKTTMVNCISKIIDPTEGLIKFKDIEYTKLTMDEIRPLRKNLQIAFQNPKIMLPAHYTVLKALEEPLLLHRKELNKEQRYSEILKIMEKINLPENYLSFNATKLSGGQQQRVSIARSIICKPELAILDEPTSALDACNKGSIVSMLLDLQKEYKSSYVVISHDLEIIMGLCDYIAVIRDGEIIDYCHASKIHESKSEYTQSILQLFKHRQI